MATSSQLVVNHVEEHQLNLPQVLLDQLSMGVAVLDQDFILRDHDPNWPHLLARYTPITADQLIPGINFFDCLPEAGPVLGPLFQQAMRGQPAYQPHLRLETTAGASYWDVAVSFQLENNEFVLAMVDVSERTGAYYELVSQTNAHAYGLTTLLEISHHLSTPEQEPLLYLILDRLRDIEDYTEAGITRLENDQVTVLAYRGFVSQEEWVGWSISVPDSPIHRQVIYQRQPVIISDIWSDSLMAQTLQNILSEKDLEKAYKSLRSWMAVPLVAKDQVIGMFFLGHRQPNRFSNQRTEIVQALADHIAVALEIDRLSRQAVNLATLEERDWLARELHDNIAQALGYMNLQLTAINEALVAGKTDEAQATLHELKQIVGETYTDVREEIFNLRATASLGFLDMLRDYLTRYRTHYELDVELDIEVDEPVLDFPAEVGTQVIRIIQEALINVRKHAGVQQAVISLKQVDDHICINVQDQGRGFSLTALNQSKNAGFGLQIMAERAQGAGGYLKVDTTPNQGTDIVVWLPITPGK